MSNNAFFQNRLNEFYGIQLAAQGAVLNDLVIDKEDESIVSAEILLYGKEEHPLTVTGAELYDYCALWLSEYSESEAENDHDYFERFIHNVNDNDRLGELAYVAKDFAMFNLASA